MRIILALLALAFLASCASTPDATPSDKLKPAAEGGKKQLAHIKKQIQNGSTDKNLADLAALREQERGTELEPEIDWITANEEFKKKMYESAGLKFLKVAKSSKNMDRRFEACQMAATAHERGQLMQKAIQGLRYCISLKTWEGDRVPKLVLLQADLYIRSGDKLQALKGFVEFVQGSTSKETEVVRNRALEMVQESLSNEELKRVGDDVDYGFLRGHAWYRLGNQMVEERNNQEAINAFRNVVSLLSGTDIAEASQQSINQIEALKKVSPSTVGAILPLSGRNAAVGQRVLRGLQLGLGLNGTSPSPFKIAVMDDENNPDIARRAVDRLVREDNVIGIVGSISSRTAAAVASQAQSLGVPSIALSQKAGITDVGPLVFRNALTSNAQVRHLVKIAMNDLGLKRFAILYPNDKFGTEYANIFWDEVLARGGEVRAAQIYDADDVNVKETVQRLIGTFYMEDRNEEYRYALKTWNETQAKKTARTEVPDDLVGPAVDFDAIFIADGVKALGQMASMLAYYNVRGVKILGPSLWNTEGVAKRTGGDFNPVIFVDGVQATEADVVRNNFIREYKALYNELPGAFEIQGFDSALILRQMLSEGADSREELSARLQAAQRVEGVLGSLQFSSEREIQRPVMTLTVEKSTVIPFDSAIKR